MKELEMTPQALRDKWGKRIERAHKYIRSRFDKEVRRYMKVFRNEFSAILTAEEMNAEKVDVNIVYPIIKTLVPRLYFKDPKVIAKALQKDIEVPQVSLEGEAIVDPETGVPLVDVYSGPVAADLMRNQLNDNIKKSKLKTEIKMCLYDMELGFYCALKTGWGNDQGVASMGEDGAPPSHREGVNDEMAYAYRIKPWDVVVDMEDFYNPKWIAVRYTASPEQLKADSRLQNTENLKGDSKIDTDRKRPDYLQAFDDQDLKLVEYYEVYVKPCAEYPNGAFYIFTPEVKHDFLYSSEWPYMVREFPIKIKYFNPDPEGGLPIPGVRYYMGQQRLKSWLRRTAVEYVQRTMPSLAVDISKASDQANVKKGLVSGAVPRVTLFNGSIENAFGGITYPPLASDFWNIDRIADDDTSRMTGMVNGVFAGSGNNVELASLAKITDRGQEVRQSEKTDILRELLVEVVSQWAGYWQEFAGPENYTLMEGEEFPRQWTKEQIQAKMIFDIQPFSMTYEDPVILRKQWTDLLNLLSSEAVQMAVLREGKQLILTPIIKKILDTFDEKEISDTLLLPTEQPAQQAAKAVVDAFTFIQTGQLPADVSEDDHPVHVAIFQTLMALLGADLAPLIALHEQALLNPGQKPGGGNPEGMPVNGVAANQDLYSAPMMPSPANKKVAIARESNAL